MENQRGIDTGRFQEPEVTFEQGHAAEPMPLLPGAFEEYGLHQVVNTRIRRVPSVRQRQEKYRLRP
jgi:hypothetical protein